MSRRIFIKVAKNNPGLSRYDSAMRRLTLWLFVAAGLSACSGSDEPASPAPATGAELLQPEPGFVGSESCAGCHKAAFDDWKGSHHQLAMQVASSATVLADFDNATVDYFGTSSTMFRDGDQFVMRTQNADGELQDFAVSYTFGVEPLQQYLTDFPDGRKQVLPFAWDARTAEEGGQRWYHLYPDEEIGHDDRLHWTGRYANWNFMCAECHSTHLETGYDLALNRYDTTWSEVSVGCEACHGPASRHVVQAQTGFDDAFGLLVDLDDRDAAAWVMNLDTGVAERSKPADRQQQPESCGRCHSRRGVIAEPYEYGKPLLDTHRLALLDAGLYHADGRILDEVYVYGSFVQSKMYRAGVTCSDCHNSHSGELVTGPDPNAVCAQCHLPAKFASTEHAPSNDCVSCHMQDEVYMGIDARRDHSFRLPDTSTDVNHYGAAIAYARAGSASPEAALDPSYPAIARATLVSMLDAPFDDGKLRALDAASRDPDPLVRIAALQAIHTAAPGLRPLLGTDLLFDPVRAVRAQAALTFVDSRDLLPLEAARAYAGAADDYRRSMLATASQPESIAMLSDFEFRMGNNQRTLEYLEQAIRVEPELGLTRYSYGLALVREKRYDDALMQFQLAYEMTADNARYAYTYAVALNQLGRVEDATRVTRKARADFPNDRDIQSFWQILNRQ